MFKKKLLLSISIILLASLAGLAYIFLKPSPGPSVSESQVKFAARQTVIYGDSRADALTELQVTEGETALDVLLRTHQVETKQYSFGVLVEGIDGVKSGDGGRYWIYYVNGESASVGAGDYQVLPGDELEWRFQESE